MQFREFDAANYIDDLEDVVAYLNVVLEDGTLEDLQRALGNIARSKGMTELSAATGITRQGLYKMLGPNGNPSFDAIQKVLEALGLCLQVKLIA